MAASNSYTGFSAVAKFAQSVTIDLASVPANSVSVETFTVPGLDHTNMLVLAQIPGLDAGLTLISTRVTTGNLLELSIQNNTGGAINPASQQVYVLGL